MSSQILELFWLLGSVDPEDRITGTKKLVECLSACRASGKVISIEDMGDCDLKYTIIRLVKGLCDPADAARQGYFTALVQCFVTFYDILPLKYLCKLCDEYLPLQVPKRGVKTEKRNRAIGRAFFASSLVRAFLVLREEHKTEFRKCEFYSLQNEDLQSDGNSLVWLTSTLFEISSKYRFLRLFCYDMLCSFFTFISKKFSKKLFFLLSPVLGIAPKNFSAEALYLALVLEVKHDILLSNFSNFWPASTSLLDPTVFSLIGPILLKTTELRGSAFGLHPVWKCIFEEFLNPSKITKSKSKSKINTSEEKEEHIVVRFWNEVIEGKLFDGTFDHKVTAFQIMETLFCDERSTPAILHKLLTTKALRTLVNNCCNPSTMLHRQSHQTLGVIIRTAKDTKNAESGLPLTLLKLLTSPPVGTLNFDRISKSQTIKLLLEAIPSTCLDATLEFLAEVFYQKVENETDEKSVNKVTSDQITAVDFMFRIAARCDEKSSLNIMKFLAFNSFFIHRESKSESGDVMDISIEADICKDKEELNASLLKMSHLIKIDKKVRNMCRNKFFAICERFLFRYKSEILLNEQIEQASKLMQFLMSLFNNESVRLADGIIESDDYLSQIEDNIASIVELLQSIDNNVAGSRNRSKSLFCLMYVGLSLLLFIPDEFNEAATTFEDLFMCFSNFEKQGLFKQYPPEVKSAHTESAEKPLLVLLDSLISLLTKPYKHIREVSDSMFRVIICPLMNLASLELLFDSLKMLDNNDDEAMQTDGQEEEEHEEEGGGGDEDSDFSDSDGDIPLPPAKRKRGKEAESIEVEEEMDEYLDDANEEDLQKYDEKLAELFSAQKQRKVRKKTLKTEATHFRMRVVELLEIYVRSLSSSAGLYLNNVVFLLEKLVAVTLFLEKNDSGVGKRLKTLYCSHLVRLKVDFAQKSCPSDVKAFHDTIERLFPLFSGKKSLPASSMAGVGIAFLVNILLSMGSGIEKKKAVESSKSLSDTGSLNIDFFQALLSVHFREGFSRNKSSLFNFCTEIGLRHSWFIWRYIIDYLFAISLETVQKKVFEGLEVFRLMGELVKITNLRSEKSEILKALFATKAPKILDSVSVFLKRNRDGIKLRRLLFVFRLIKDTAMKMTECIPSRELATIPEAKVLLETLKPFSNSKNQVVKGTCLMYSQIFEK